MEGSAVRLNLSGAFMANWGYAAVQLHPGGLTHAPFSPQSNCNEACRDVAARCTSHNSPYQRSRSGGREANAKASGAPPFNILPHIFSHFPTCFLQSRVRDGKPVCLFRSLWRPPPCHPKLVQRCQPSCVGAGHQGGRSLRHL